MTRPRLILFDVDGTLVDSFAAIHSSMVTAFDAAGRPAPTEGATKLIIGLSLPKAIATLAPDATAAEQARITSAYQASQTGVDHAASPLFPGIAALLDRLAARDTAILGVATGKARRGFDRFAAAHGLEGRFLTIQTSDLHPSKPHPSMVTTAMAETGCMPEDTVMIGDTEFDIAMGVAAGVATIGVAWGYHPVEALRAAGARRVADDAAALGAAIDTLLWGDDG